MWIKVVKQSKKDPEFAELLLPGKLNLRLRYQAFELIYPVLSANY